MKWFFASQNKSKRKSHSRRTAKPGLRFEQCEDRLLMAANILQLALPAPLPSATVAVAPAVPVSTAHSSALAPFAVAAAPTAAATQAVTTQAKVSTTIDLDATVQSGSVTPTLAKDLNLLHFYGGEQLTVPTLVKNYGPGTASGSATVSIYLSTTNTLNANSVLLGQKTVNINLGNNATTVVSLDTKVPTTLTAGTSYFIISKVTTPLTQSTINDVRPSNRTFEFVGTPTTNLAAFQPDASGNILYFKFIRDTLNSRFVGADRDITFRFNDAQSFIGSFEGDERFPYLKNGVPMIGLGINLNTIDATTAHVLASYVASYAKSTTGQTLTGSDSAIINMLKVQAFSGGTTYAISAAQDQSLFALTYPDRQAPAIAALGNSVWSKINPTARIALMDQVYATGNVYASMLPALKSLDYVRAGFQLVDNAHTTQSAGWTIRAEAEYENLLYSTRTSLGGIVK